MMFLSDDDILIITLVFFGVSVTLGVSFCFCCCSCDGKGFIAIGILKVVASFFILGIFGMDSVYVVCALIFVGLNWIAAGKSKINNHTKRARLAAMREEGNTGEISPDAVNSAQAVVHNTEATEAHLVLNKPVLVADDP